jgi:hypothetical protein
VKLVVCIVTSKRWIGYSAHVRIQSDVVFTVINCSWSKVYVNCHVRPTKRTTVDVYWNTETVSRRLQVQCRVDQGRLVAVCCQMVQGGGDVCVDRRTEQCQAYITAWSCWILSFECNLHAATVKWVTRRSGLGSGNMTRLETWTGYQQLLGTSLFTSFSDEFFRHVIVNRSGADGW